MADAVEVENYTQFVERKEVVVDIAMVNRLIDCVRDIHALVGVASELGEWADQLKKHIFHGAPLNRLNIKEEIGDVVFYSTLGAIVIGTTIEDTMQANRRKLEVRYKQRLTAEESINRDVVAEAAVLGDDDLGEDQ